MPLMPRDGGARRRIEITAEIDPSSVGDWYEIKTRLGYYERAQASNARGVSFKVPARKLERGNVLDPHELVTVSMDNQADAMHYRLAIYLSAWSHAEDISSLTIKRIPEAHVAAILDAIEEVEREQDGPQLGDPLANGSTG